MKKTLVLALAAIVTVALGVLYLGQSRNNDTYAAAEKFCEEMLKMKCSAVSVEKRGEVALVKTDKNFVLISKRSGAWSGVLAANDDNICNIGTDSPDVKDFCK